MDDFKLPLAGTFVGYIDDFQIEQCFCSERRQEKLKMFRVLCGKGYDKSDYNKAEAVQTLSCAKSFDCLTFIVFVVLLSV